MTGRGFEPLKLTHCILSATPLTARETCQNGGGGIRTHEP